MDETIARLNIQRFRELLANEKDEAKRQTIRELLSAEEKKLKVLESVRPQRKTR